jgi:uncharacterized membrane protein
MGTTMVEWKLVALVSAAVGSGVMAGVFFTFSNSIMSSLGKLPPQQGMDAMNHINVVIINPLFLLAFLGSGLLCLVLGGAAALQIGAPGSLLALVASVLYVAGCFGVTMLANVPLNNALAAMGSQAPGSAALWATYLTRWTLWNHVRAVACLGSTILFIVAARKA